jgi:hypothetical protein
MAFNLKTTDLAKLNSLTKYPSIPTYHTLDAKNGGLIEVVMAFDGAVIGTEKVDGTNSRVIVTSDGQYLIGSREELLYARGDLICNPAMGIVEALKALAEKLCADVPNGIAVYYFEVFGGKVTAASKQYTSEQRVSFRLFDIARLEAYDTLLAQSLPQISLWREGGGQMFVNEGDLQTAARNYELTLTPRLFTVDVSALPQTIDAALAFLKEWLPTSLSTLDEQAGGKPEGIVLRTPDRSRIAKARFEDYERTPKRRK